MSHENHFVDVWVFTALQLVIYANGVEVNLGRTLLMAGLTTFGNFIIDKKKAIEALKQEQGLASRVFVQVLLEKKEVAKVLINGAETLGTVDKTSFSNN